MRRFICIASGLVLSSSSAAFAAAADAPSNPNILSAIQQLQLNDTQEAATLQGIQKSLTDLQTAIQNLTPPGPGNVLNTAVLFLEQLPAAQNAVGVCTSTNLSTESRSVHVELLNGASVPIQNATFGVSPGGSGALTGDGAGFIRCRFTVQNGGTTQGILGVLTREVFTAGALVDSVSLPAR